MVSCKVYPPPGDNEVGATEMKRLLRRINEVLLDDGSNAVMNVILFDRNPLSKEERKELMDYVSQHVHSESVKVTADAIEVTTPDRLVRIVLIFGGNNNCKDILQDKKEASKRPRDSIDSLDDDSLGSFLDITGQGMTQATAPFFNSSAATKEDSDEE